MELTRVDQKAAATPRLSKRTRDRLFKAGVLLVVIPLAVLFLAPFYWMVSTSLKDPRYIYLFPPQWIPDPVRLDNYVKALTRMPFGLYAWNTIKITALALIGHLLSASMVAYGFARLRFPGRDLLFILLLTTIMLPTQVTLIPTFLIYRGLGWVDTINPLFVPDWLGGAPFTVFLLRQFITTIPHDLDDAAKIDGCSFFGIYWRIILPLIKPALATVAIFVFLLNWNDFYYAVIYLNSRDNWTLSLGLNFLRRAGGLGAPSFVEMEIVMAASVVIMLPCLIVFFLAQRVFVQGIVFSGLKG